MAPVYAVQWQQLLPLDCICLPLSPLHAAFSLQPPPALPDARVSPEVSRLWLKGKSRLWLKGKSRLWLKGKSRLWACGCRERAGCG
jgi:hypothetical protein